MQKWTFAMVDKDLLGDEIDSVIDTFPALLYASRERAKAEAIRLLQEECYELLAEEEIDAASLATITWTEDEDGWCTCHFEPLRRDVYVYPMTMVDE